jgi:tetratricopeptide (TPR) repeat protein
MGEQGIAAFILGDTETAKKRVIRAWMLSKVERDTASTVRYESVFGAGLVQIHRYKEALTPLNEAIKLATANPSVAYPTIAVYAKIDALVGLHRSDEALALANQSLARLQGTLYDGHKAQVYIARGSIYRERGEWNAAIADYQSSLGYSTRIGNYRGITDAGGLLAQAYEHNHDLPAALAAIDSAVTANTKIPEELYLVPRNLSIKAEIVSQMGHTKEAESLYLKSITLVDTMVRYAPTINIQSQLLAEMSDVYSGYFSSLCEQKRYAAALQTLEQIRGRVETEALEHHANQTVHAPTPEEIELTRLNLALINSDDPQAREKISNAIYSTELSLNPSAMTQETIANPIRLTDLQRTLSPHALLIEYVLAEPNSYALAITDTDVTPYQLPAKSRIETDAKQYIAEIHAKKEDAALAQDLYEELLQPIRKYPKKTDLIVVPDGLLHLLTVKDLNSVPVDLPHEVASKLRQLKAMGFSQ